MSAPARNANRPRRVTLQTVLTRTGGNHVSPVNLFFALVVDQYEPRPRMSGAAASTVSERARLEPSALLAQLVEHLHGKEGVMDGGNHVSPV